MQTTINTQRPYQPSWVDYLITWIKHLPSPSWLFYVLVLLGFIVGNNAVQWFDGGTSAGTISWIRSVEALFPIYFLVTMHYLNSTALRALNSFHPALDITESDYIELRYKLTTIPSSIGYLAAVVGIVLGVLAVNSATESFGISTSSSGLTRIYIFTRSAFTSATGAAFIYHTVHQLHLISLIHKKATHINIFQTGPVYAFSTLSFRTGISFIIYSCVIIILNAKSSIDLVSLGVLALFIMAAIASFILPLRGMHLHLTSAKSSLIGENTRRIEAMMTDLHRFVDTHDLDKVGDVNGSIASLITERSLLLEIRTWPWEPEMFRGIISAILLPITLYIVTQMLSKLLHL